MFIYSLTVHADLLVGGHQEAGLAEVLLLRGSNGGVALPALVAEVEDHELLLNAVHVQAEKGLPLLAIAGSTLAVDEQAGRIVGQQRRRQGGVGAVRA